MAQTPIVLLATDYLLKGDGLAPSSAVVSALDAAIGKFSTDSLAELIDEDTGSQYEWAADLSAVAPMVLNNVGTRITDLLSTDEQGIRKFVSIFQASSGASSMTTGTLDAAASLKSFKSFNDFGPNINNIQDLVTGGKTGSFPGGADSMKVIGDSLKGMGSLYSGSPADLGNPGALIQSLNSQGVLPASVTAKLDSMGVSPEDAGDLNEATLQKMLGSVNDPADLAKISTITGIPSGKLSNLGDALDTEKLLSPKASSSFLSGLSMPSIPSGLHAGTKDEDLTYTGDDYIVWDNTNAERLKRGLPSLEAIGSPRPPEDSTTSTSAASPSMITTSVPDVGIDTTVAGSNPLSSLGSKLQTVGGTASFSEIGKKLSSTKVPQLKHLMASPPDFSKVGDSLKDKFTTVSLPAGLPTNISSPPAGFESLLNSAKSAGSKLSIPSMPGHIPKVPSIPGAPSLPLQIPGFAPGGAIDTSLYVGTKDEDLTYTGDDHIVWDRVNTERLNRGLPDLAAIGSPRPEEPAAPPTATPNGTPGVFQMLGTISSQGPIFPHLEYLAGVSISSGTKDEILKTLADIQVALDQEGEALKGAGVDLSYPGPTGYVGVTMFAEKLHQFGVDKQNLGLGRFIEELAESADSAGGDSVVAALYEGRNLAS